MRSCVLLLPLYQVATGNAVGEAMGWGPNHALQGDLQRHRGGARAAHGGMMRTLAFTLALSACAATPAHADAFTKREVAFQVLNAADAATTCHAVNSGQAVEGNPLISGVLGKRPSCGSLVAFKAATGALHWLIASEINKRDPNGAKWFQIVSIGVQGGVVAANLRFVF